MGRSSNCYKCRVTDHWARECKDCEPTCFKCGLNGHISTRCREPERSQNTTRGGSRGGYGSRGRTGYQGTRRIEDDRSRGSDGEDYNLMRALEEESLRLGNDFNIQLLVNDEWVRFIIDTGVAVSIITEETVSELGCG